MSSVSESDIKLECTMQNVGRISTTSHQSIKNVWGNHFFVKAEMDLEPVITIYETPSLYSIYNIIYMIWAIYNN